MKIPIMVNAREVVRSWRTDAPVHPEVRETGHGPTLDQDVISLLVEELTALTRTLPSSDDGRREFDQRAAQLLGQRLNLSSALAADKRFWQWFSITRAQEIVLWRWKKHSRASVSEDRWLGGWKDTFRRLWLRANIIREDGADEPFALAGHGDEDFWVGIIERDIAACRGVVRGLVHRFFIAQDTGSPQRMEHYRRTLKRLRQIRPNRVYEHMSDPEIATLVGDAVTATIPSDTPTGTRKPRRKTSSKKKVKTRRTTRRVNSQS